MCQVHVFAVVIHKVSCFFSLCPGLEARCTLIWYDLCDLCTFPRADL